MTYNFNTFQTSVKAIEAWLHNEFSNIRTGRASISFLDQVRVEAYGEMSPLANVASVGIEDAKTIKISPWDASLIRAIEKGIAAADLGISTAVDSNGIRVIFPDLTGERRQQLAKQAKAKLEEAKVQLRLVRSDVNDDMSNKKKDGEMTEDEVSRGKKDLDAHMATASAGLDTIFSKKEQEILTQ
ncbi:MAG: ribosome recycling factor [Patescibacteria group bacterium]